MTTWWPARPALRVPVHQRFFLQEPNAFGTLDGLDLERRTSLDRLLPQLGTLAIESGKLTVKQVFQVLREQNARPEELFGELAVEAGFLSEEELAGQIYLQSLRVQTLVDILVEQGHLPADVADEHLASYRKENQQAENLEPVEAS